MKSPHANIKPSLLDLDFFPHVFSGIATELLEYCGLEDNSESKIWSKDRVDCICTTSGSFLGSSSPHRVKFIPLSVLSVLSEVVESLLISVDAPPNSVGNVVN
jgi:hypothetical protein